MRRAVIPMRGRGAPDDRYERLNDAFHQRVLDGFRQIAVEPRHVVIDAAADPDAVHAAIMAAVRRLV